MVNQKRSSMTDNGKSAPASEDPTLSLRVAEALPKDVGRGLARLDPQALEHLGAKIGDVVEIVGTRVTVARAMPTHASHRGQDLIQIDGILRANAGVSLGERVTVSQTEIQPARTITLAPVKGARRSTSPGQARYLVENVNLRSRRKLLDLGGGAASYSIAL